MIKVKREKWAERCEICHKADCFDPLKNYCLRCSQLQKSEEILTPIAHTNLDPFGRPLIVGFIDVHAEILRETNKKVNSHYYSPDISFLWATRGFITGSVVSFVVFSISFLTIIVLSYPNLHFINMFFALIIVLVFITFIFGLLGAIIGFSCACAVILFDFFRDKFLKEGRNLS